MTVFLFLIPQTRTTSYMNSYFPSTIKLWNSLPYHIRSLPTLSSFINAIKKTHYRTPNKLFNHGNRSQNIIHCQLRNNASSLNADLLKDYISDSSKCENCDFHIENAYHFFFECPCYVEQRNTLFHCISSIDLQNPIPISLNLLLFGDSSISYAKNMKLFDCVHNYISQTKRFHK